MRDTSLIIDHIPPLQSPLLIAGFEGWGNALDVSIGMVDFMIRALKATSFAHLNPDPYYRYDEQRPRVRVENGRLTELTSPAAEFFSVSRADAGRDLILFRATEPHLQWYRFTSAVLSVCEQTETATLITLGSMFDDVLHSYTNVSAFASRHELLSGLERAYRIAPVNYKGPSAIHSILHQEAAKRGMDAVSFWCHCPYYLQGTTHFGLLSHLGSLLASWGRFRLDTRELDETWRDLNRQIQEIIEKNPELQHMITDLRRAKVKGSWDGAKRHDNVIHLEDFLRPG